MRPARSRSSLGDLGVAELGRGRDIEDAGRLGRGPPPSGRRRARAGRLAPSRVEAREGGLEQGRALLGRSARRAKAVSTPCARARRRPRPARPRWRSPCRWCKSYCGGTACAGGLARLVGPDRRSRSSSARGATMSSRATGRPSTRPDRLGRMSTREDRGQREDQRSTAATSRGAGVVAREPGEAPGCVGPHGSLIGVSASRRHGRRGRRARGAAATRPLTTLPSARPRVRGDEPAHDLAHVARRSSRRSRRRLVDEGVDLGLGQGCREELAEDGDLGLLLGGQVLAAAAAERLDRLAPGLDLARQHGQELVLGRAALVCASRRCRRHSPPCAARRGAARHPPAWRR